MRLDALGDYIHMINHNSIQKIKPDKKNKNVSHIELEDHHWIHVKHSPENVLELYYEEKNKGDDNV